MRLIKKNLIKKFKRMSMSTKLTVSFSVPVIVLFLVMISIAYSRIYNNYSRQVLTLADQSFNQAKDFLSNTIDYMTYISDQIYYDGNLQRIISSDEFNGDRDIGEQYREYLVLENLFKTVEMSETIYRAGIYIPDELIYSYNGHHFMKQTELKARSDYEKFIEGALLNKVFFTNSEYVRFSGMKEPIQLVSLLREIRSTDGDFKRLSVVQVSIESSNVRKIIENADITKAGLVYLTNDRGEILSSSNNEMLAELQKQGNLPDYSKRAEWMQWSENGEEYLVNREYLPKASWYLMAILPTNEINRERDEMSILIFAISTVIILVICISSYILAGHFVKRLNKLNETIEKVQNGDFNINLQQDEGDEIAELTNNFSHMAKKLKHLINEQYKSGRAVVSAEMKALQAQINPHFLYNTLDLINWAAYDYGAVGIAEIAQKLAQFYKISLNKGRNVVIIEEELKHVTTYVDIENYHFANAINLEIDVSEEIRNLACINIILQPFVENAIMHGIAKDPSIHECNIIISAKKCDEDISLYIKDDGIGMEQEEVNSIFTKNTYNNSHGYGIKNIDSRLKLCYGDEYGVTFESIPGEGTTAIISIPVLTIKQIEEKLSM